MEQKVASAQHKRHDRGKTENLIELLISRLRKESGLKVESAYLSDGEAAIRLSGSGSTVAVQLLPGSDRPHYCRTKHFTIYYLGDGDLQPREKAILDKTISLLQGLEEVHGDGPIVWPPRLPEAGPKTGMDVHRAGKSGPTPENTIVLNRWKELGTGLESLEVTLRVWNSCNQRCRFCQVQGRSWDISHETILETIERYGDGSVSTKLNLTGGEPTLNPKLHDYIHRALALKYNQVLVQTNAVRYSDPGSVRTLPKSAVLEFLVSLHGFDSSTYDDATRTKGQFAKALAGVNNLISAGYKVRLNVVLTSRNLSIFPSMVNKVPALFPNYRKNLSLKLSTMGGFPTINEHAGLLPRLTDVFRITREAVAEARKIGLTVRDFSSSGFCSLPPCVLSPARRSRMSAVMTNVGDFTGGEKHSGGTGGCNEMGFVKSSACRDCEFDRNCPGVLEAYARLYGMKELKAVKKAGRSTGG